ncbi:hypothetical protein FBU59_004407 [Linderina macrospora]|uniref:Uncharacterized protein n=1 Tax=Linderina macrospora TaxID=4868 RepID=A0ACC1J5M1_9FUNG|nr:hypothetical protein FBU59_004407 [Linderina macrospora]
MFGYSETEVFHKLRGGSEFPNGSPLTGDFIVDLTKPAVVMCPETNMAMNIDIVHNACHLESGAPVALGKSRTKDANIARARKSDRYTVGDHVLAVSVHGDSVSAVFAAFCRLDRVHDPC